MIVPADPPKRRRISVTIPPVKEEVVGFELESETHRWGSPRVRVPTWVVSVGKSETKTYRSNIHQCTCGAKHGTASPQYDKAKVKGCVVHKEYVDKDGEPTLPKNGDWMRMFRAEVAKRKKARLEREEREKEVEENKVR